jgi:hypothetical protein
MKVVKGLALTLLVLAAALAGLYFAMAERVEVVVLHHHGEGGEQTTRLWVVDDAGAAWLRTGADNASWLPRIRSNPAIELERGGETHRYTALVLSDPETVARINALMLQKYGWSEQLLRSAGAGALGQVAIRLEPR